MKTIKANKTPSSRSGAAVVCAVLATTAMLVARSAATHQAHLLKVARLPRVYNTLITSEQDLLPSQAYPIVSPTIRLSPVIYGWPYAAAASDVVPVIAYPSRSVVDDPTGVRNAISAGGDGIGGEGGSVDDDAPPPPPPRPAVKNNRPVDSAVPDVPPPPPLPVSVGRPDKKKPEEYPPAPVGFAL